MKVIYILLQAVPPGGRSGGFHQYLIPIIAIFITAIIFIAMRNRKKDGAGVYSGQDNRYPALKIIASIYKAIAILIGTIALLMAGYFFSQNTPANSSFGGISLVVGTLITLGLLAISESIMVLIDIEKNTREAAKK